MTSIFEKWSPVTYDFGLIQSSMELVTDSYQEWFAESGAELIRRPLEGSLTAKFEALLPLTNSLNRRLFLPSDCGWVAFFQNGIQGSDPSFNMMKLSLRLNVYAMRVCRSPPAARYPSVIWEVFAPESLGGTRHGYRRSIAASNDGGRWIFEQSGTPFDFERVKCYEAKRKVDRFTGEMLEDYLNHFGIPELSDELLITTTDLPAVLFEQEKATSLPEFTLEEVTQGVPWRRKLDSGA